MGVHDGLKHRLGGKVKLCWSAGVILSEDRYRGSASATSKDGSGSFGIWRSKAAPVVIDDG